jgi:hypothetical protein
MEATMKLVTKTALVAHFLLLAFACNNEIDPVIGEYSVDVFNGLIMPISETQTEISDGVLCDIERNGIIAFSENLGFSLSVQERIFNCTDIDFNDDDTVLILGNVISSISGSFYSVRVEVGNVNVSLDCNLQEDSLFCQGNNANTVVEFQATRVE